MGSRLPLPRTPRALAWLAVGTFAGLVLLAAVVYPRVNVHLPHMGSDDDDALNLGVRAILHGRSPYGEPTYLGNVVHQLPGAIVLAAPFVLMGSSAIQNLFWIPLFFLVAWREARTWMPDADTNIIRLTWTVLGASPIVIHEVATGTGHSSNAIFVLVGLWWLVRTRRPVVASVLWGVALASRANFVLLMPIAWGALRRRWGIGLATACALVSATTVAALTLPFYLHDPAGFGPMEAMNRLTVFDEFLPHAGFGLGVAMTAVAGILAFRPLEGRRLYGSAALVQATPVAIGAALAWWSDPDFALWYLTYGLFALWFVVMAMAVRPGDARSA
jgi:hypothetical protein